jgi:late competence protein required for DNA uptake (superfamily II DNA/RNA helicase)
MENEKHILECWYSGQIPEREFFDMLSQNHKLLKLWHEQIIINSKKMTKKENQKRRKSNRINPKVIEWNKKQRHESRPVPAWKIDLFKIVNKYETKNLVKLNTKSYNS